MATFNLDQQSVTVTDWMPLVNGLGGQTLIIFDGKNEGRVSVPRDDAGMMDFDEHELITLMQERFAIRAVPGFRWERDESEGEVLRVIGAFRLIA